MPAKPTLSVDDFVAKWQRVSARETQAAQSHFNDLCAVLGVENPIEGDPEGIAYAFEKGIRRPDGSTGQADVRKEGRFGWEYKGKNKDLATAYDQLLGYREGLGNPPLLVVCDMNRFEVHTNFTNTEPRVIRFTLKDLRENPTYYTNLLRDIFLDPDALHPNNDPRYITETAAVKFGEVAEALRTRDGHDPALVARFLNRLIFCLFAESIRLFRYPRGRVIHPVTETIAELQSRPEATQDILGQLFRAMASESVINFGFYPIRWFNGGLFDEAAPKETLPLTGDLVQILAETGGLSWARIDPAIFGTLFERGLDPNRRSQTGAHYTDPDNIMRVIEPVMLRPLRREFAELRAATERETGVAEAEPPAYGSNGWLGLDEPDPDSAEGQIRAFHKRLADVRILDPACGSGNFLYMAMRALRDIEHELIEWAQAQRVNGLEHRTGPQNMLGIDIDRFAVELTRMSLWIGHIQWNYEHNIGTLRDPVLGPIEQIECRDAILDEDEEGKPVAAEWPEAEFIVGNPPFLGMKRMRSELGNSYVEGVRTAWAGALDGRVDLCVYWHEAARRQIMKRATLRAGLLATQNIRGSFSRPVLQRIRNTGQIFLAHSDEPWVNDGAAVRIAIVCQDDGSEPHRELDDTPVVRISSRLTSGTDLSRARELNENRNTAFQGVILTGDFDVTQAVGERMLAAPINVNGRPNADVVHPFASGSDIAHRPAGRYVIDFGVDMSESTAAKYQDPFEHIVERVKPYRLEHDRENIRSRWWLHEAPRPEMRRAISPLTRWLATSLTAKHLYFVWMQSPTVPQSTVVVVARSDDYAFGVLHSRIHQSWALAQGSRLGVGNDPRYVHTQCFNTFPFPWALDTPDDALSESQAEHRDAIAAAAASLNAQREAWLNPSDAGADELLRRTMTNLYNERPSWLDMAHLAIDEAVLAAYGWSADLADDDILAHLLALNAERAAR